MMISDFFSARRTENFAITTEILGIELIFLHPYSPKLNPIETKWKSIKKEVPQTFMKDQEMMFDAIKANFIEFSRSKPFSKNRVEAFVNLKEYNVMTKTMTC